MVISVYIWFDNPDYLPWLIWFDNPAYLPWLDFFEAISIYYRHCCCAFDFAFSIVMLFLFDFHNYKLYKLQLLFDTSDDWFSPNFIGCKLSQHQGSAGPDLPDCCWHDQGQNPRGDPQDLQHQEWLHPWGGRGDPQGEPVGLWVRRCWTPWSLDA